MCELRCFLGNLDACAIPSLLLGATEKPASCAPYVQNSPTGETLRLGKAHELVPHRLGVDLRKPSIVAVANGSILRLGEVPRAVETGEVLGVGSWPRKDECARAAFVDDEIRLRMNRESRGSFSGSTQWASDFARRRNLFESQLPRMIEIGHTSTSKQRSVLFFAVRPTRSAR